MAWQDAAISALSIVFLISHAVYAALAAALAATAGFGLYLLRLASWPISAFCNALLFAFAPVIYTIRWVDIHTPEPGTREHHIILMTT